MGMTAVAAYVARFDAREAQDRRVFGERPGDVWEPLVSAGAFQRDPRRAIEQPDPELAAVLPFVRPEDVVLDVGGGAGRFGLPLALRCGRVINVDPSPSMGQAFQRIAAEAGIGNVQLIPHDWLSAPELTGDLSLVAYVTYFVREIVPFIEKLVRASRRRVVVLLHSLPPPDRGADLFRLAYDEEQERVPGYRELVPVLWEMGILPEIRVLPADGRETMRLPKDRDAASAQALAGWPRRGEEERARRLIEAHFDELFIATPQGFQRRALRDQRTLLITWETQEHS
jgi:SAM-dependent methyltransferase